MEERTATEEPEPLADHLEAYLDLTDEEVARIVLWLMIEDALKGRLAVFRPGEPNLGAVFGLPGPAPLVRESNQASPVRPPSRPI